MSKVANSNMKNVICSELGAIRWSGKRMFFPLPWLSTPGDETKGEYLYDYRGKSTVNLGQKAETVEGEEQPRDSDGPHGTAETRR